jgi:hypothetical protein
MSHLITLMLITCHSEERSDACPEPAAWLRMRLPKSLAPGNHAFFDVREISFGFGRDRQGRPHLCWAVAWNDNPLSPAKVLKRVMEGAVIRTISSLVIPPSAPFGYALVTQLGPKYQLASVSHKPSSPAP